MPRRVEPVRVRTVERPRRHPPERRLPHRHRCSRGLRQRAPVQERLGLRAISGRRRPRQHHVVPVPRAPDPGDDVPGTENRGDGAGSADVRAQQRAEEDGRLAVAEDVAAVALVNVEIPATRRYRRGHVGEDPDRVGDPAVAVGDQVSQHVLDRPLALAAAQVDVRGVRPGGQPASLDGDSQRVALGVIGNGGPSPRRAPAGASPAYLDRDQPVRPAAAAQQPGLRDRLPGDAAVPGPHADHQAAPVRQRAREAALQGGAGAAGAAGRQRAEPDRPGVAGEQQVHAVLRAGREPGHDGVHREPAGTPAEGDRPARHGPQAQGVRRRSGLSGLSGLAAPRGRRRPWWRRQAPPPSRRPPRP